MQKHTDPKTLARFWAKVDKTDTCWLWTASRTRNGYGMFNAGGKTGVAHRYAYEALVGPIPAKHELDHRCYTRHCVNPAHLNPVTMQKNQENRVGARRDSKSGYRGVIQNRNGSPIWWVFVQVNKVRYQEGPFRSPEAANEAAIALRCRVMSNNLLDRAAACMMEQEAA